MDFEPLILTFKLASITTVLLFVIAIPLCYWLVQTRSKTKPIIETLVSMPLVLPPTVLGFYFLVFLSPNTVFGNWLENILGIKLIFSFTGLVIASIIYSLPFMVHPIQAGLSALPKSYTETAKLMGKSKWTILSKILIPNIKPAILTGLVLTFAHTIGEFGVVLMIGGNIPGKTKVASIAIYDEVETLNYAAANQYSLILLIISFVILLSVYLINGGYLKRTVR
ncbi:molybdenum ABC transporter permease [Wenyingzhuangia fucanilytica]|uniref:Molybdenum transport system permease n=1 Tax=Wenyingzhuangia fucanilytica TaxID=1790137 RepID=A0A1B1Y589_9FLAO|nr:molybdate ABC transporter permease subunit [Wenyingzhuangia fucanilytica]ANW95951.1 molybdenum ABC transporter permease [Wenyingzhuangia fucanilytica]